MIDIDVIGTSRDVIFGTASHGILLAAECGGIFLAFGPSGGYLCSHMHLHKSKWPVHREYPIGSLNNATK